MQRAPGGPPVPGLPPGPAAPGAAAPARGTELPPLRRSPRSGRDDGLAPPWPPVRRAGPARAGRRGVASGAGSTGVAAPLSAPPVADSASPAPAPGPVPLASHRAGHDDPIVVDRVVAVVGNRPVLASQVDEELFTRQAQGAAAPGDAGGARRAPAPDHRRRSSTRSCWSSRRSATPRSRSPIRRSPTASSSRSGRSGATSRREVDYEDELRKAGFQTPEEYRRWLSDQQRRAALQNRLIEKLRTDGKLKPVSPTEQEMRAYFEAQKGRLGQPPRDALVPADRHRAAARRPRPRRAPGRRRTRSSWRSGTAPTSPRPPSASRRTPARASRAARSTGSAAA